MADTAKEKNKRFPGGAFGLSLVSFGLMNMVVFGGIFADKQTESTLAKDVLAAKKTEIPSGSWTWWAAHGYFEDKNAPDVVMLGSSLVNSACWAADAITTGRPVDCASHHRVFTLEKTLKSDLNLKDPHVVNVSVQGAAASDYYMITRGLTETGRKPKVIVLGIAPRDFIDNKMQSLGGTEPFMFFQRYVDFDDTVAKAYANPYERGMSEMEWRLGQLPLRKLHANVKPFLTDPKTAAETNVSNNNQLRSALSNGAIKIRPGDIVVPATMSDLWFDNTKEYVSRYSNPNPPTYKTQLFFFDETLKRMNAEGIKVLVVEMPTLPMNRSLLPEQFWTSYREQLNALCKKNNASYLDLSDNPDYVKADYVDTCHVNWRGGAKVLKRISEELAKQPQIAEVLRTTSRDDADKSLVGATKSTPTN